MFHNFYIIIFALMLTSCLQEPAPIVGKRNYYIDESSNSTNNLGCETIPDNKQDNEEKTVTLDPYLDKNTPSIENPEIDWNKLFDEENINKSEKDLDTDIKFNDASKDTKDEHEPQIKKQQINRKIEQQSKMTDKRVEQVKQNKLDKTTVQAKIRKPVEGEMMTDSSDSSDGVIFKTKDKNILSVGNGQVIYLDDEKSHSEKTIVTKLDNGFIVSYSFKGHTKVALDSKITSGQIIGEISDESDKLYCSIRQNGKKIDPTSVME